LLKWELFLFSNYTMSALYAMATLACFIIIVAAVFCIRNSFMISMAEKLRLFGMLSSVGATKKQCRRMVYYEALFFGMVGIPLGILSGVLATVVVIKMTSSLLVSAMGIELVYAMSYPAMAVGAVLSALVVFLSAGKAARRAGKITPISAIRSDTEVKVRKRERQAPKLIWKLFGIGGVIAFQNLRRARRKYRTTVLSIVVSVAIFIGLSATLRLGFAGSSVLYDDYNYQLCVYLYDDDHYAQAQRIAEMEGIEKVTIRKHMYSFNVQQGDVKFSEEYLQKILTPDAASGEAMLSISVITLGRTAYENYVRELGLSPDEIGERAILFSYYEKYQYEDGRTKYMEGSSFDYHPGDVITGKDIDEEEISFEIAVQTDRAPMGDNYGIGALIVSDDWMLKHTDYFEKSARVYIQCEDPDSLSAAISEELGFGKFSILNVVEEYRKSQSLFLLISIFLYGFITVIALIGITNIFMSIIPLYPCQRKDKVRSRW
ncbi:MAG: FtsX-like permease family protein, partial [Lachnospiraceae bacterium]|nr:FtsX-like permease family protein [Lachnospiraceae bacterium]